MSSPDAPAPVTAAPTAAPTPRTRPKPRSSNAPVGSSLSSNGLDIILFVGIVSFLFFMLRSRGGRRAQAAPEVVTRSRRSERLSKEALALRRVEYLNYIDAFSNLRTLISEENLKQQAEQETNEVPAQKNSSDDSDSKLDEIPELPERAAKEELPSVANEPMPSENDNESSPPVPLEASESKLKDDHETQETTGGFLDTLRSVVPHRQSLKQDAVCKLPNRLEGQSETVSCTCAVCLDSFAAGDFVVGSQNKDCDHVFHQHCIVDYLSFKAGINDVVSQTDDEPSHPCPCCRRPFLLPTTL